MQLVSLILIHWIVIYPVDSAIQLLNNWGLQIQCKVGIIIYYWVKNVPVDYLGNIPDRKWLDPGT